MKDNFKKLFSYKMLLIIAGVVIVMAYLHCNYKDESWYPLWSF